MWVTPDRVFYVGLLGAPSVRMMGSVIVYVAVEGAIRIRIDNKDWRVTEMAVVPPYVPHEVLSEARTITVIKAEAETVDLAALPEILRGRGPVAAPDFVARVKQHSIELCGGVSGDLMSLDFDRLFFDEPLASRRIDRRIQEVIDAIKRDPSAPALAEDCADGVGLSFSRFLHLFKDEIGVPFRSFRSWKRARSVLLRVNRKSNLAHVALDAGYPDSTHFSHSIRQVYGLKPKDIFAGSRRLAVYANELAPTWEAGRR
jgi:AraC-like DNA-binding protein